MDEDLWLSSPVEFCKKEGLGPRATEEVENGTKFNQTIYNMAAIRLALALGKENEELIPNFSTFKEKQIVALWVAWQKKGDGKYNAADLIQAACQLGMIQKEAVSAFFKKDKKKYAVDFIASAAAFMGGEVALATGKYASDEVCRRLVQQHASFSSSYYAPYTTIVGPSGLGKSFCVKQLALRHGIFVAYSNLSDASFRGYPRPVTMGTIPGDDDKKWTLYLENQIRLVEACQAAGVTAPGLMYLLTSSDQDVKAERQGLEEVFRSGDLSRVRTMEELVPHLVRVKEILTSLGLNVGPVLAEQHDTPRPPIIICLDEAATLLKTDEMAVDSGPFRSMRRAAKVLSMKDQYKRGDDKLVFFVLLLGTSSKIHNFTPTVREDRSLRYEGSDLFSPIHQIDTLDLFATAEPPSDPLSTSDEAMARRLFSCGRPLWGAYLVHGKYDANTILKTALAKIQNPLVSATPDKQLYSIAVLSYRMRFYVASPAMAEEMVASMMRYIVAVAPDRRSLVTTHPSEPIMAYASARILQDSEARKECVQLWVSALHAGTVNPGDVGEQVACLILLFSFDHFACPSSGLPHAIFLREFLETLLGEAALASLLKTRASAAITKDILNNGLVFFNHFVRMTDKPTYRSLERAYQRGAALFLPTYYPGMDIVIPVRMPDMTVGEEGEGSGQGGQGGSGRIRRLSLLLIQIKNRAADSPRPSLEILMQEDLDEAAKSIEQAEGGSGGGSGGRVHGVLGLAMCLRTRSKNPSFSVSRYRPRDFTQVSGDISGPGTRRKRKASAAKSSASNVPKAAPDFLGMVFGLDMDVYPGLRTVNKNGEAAATGGAPKTDTVDPNMVVIVDLLRNLLGNWPEAYSQNDLATEYAQKLVCQF